MSHVARTDEELLAAAAADAAAFGEFYRRHVDAVLGFFFRRTLRADLAADLCSETFASALGSCANYRVQEAPARSWLFAIASRKLVDSYRRGRVEAEARLRLGMAPIVLSDERLERIAEEASQWTEGSLMRYLNELPDAQRSAVLGRVVEELSYEDLAAKLHCSEEVVRQRVSRGLGRLRGRMRGAS